MIFFPSYSDCLDCCSASFASNVSVFKPYLLTVLTKSESGVSSMEETICSVPKISYPFADNFETALSKTPESASPS